MFENMDSKEWLALNAKLQQKKNAMRNALKEKGILKREGNNAFDKYSYFSEAQYKALFTGLLSEHKLELKFDEVDYETFEGTEKQANGRLVNLNFSLFDCETGFFETTTITGEALDKGDKAGYKAYTGALKYYLADTFMVATGDDPETESPEQKANTVKPNDRKATPKQIEMLLRYYKGENLTKLLTANNIEKIEDIPMKKASELSGKLRGATNNG